MIESARFAKTNRPRIRKRRFSMLRSDQWIGAEKVVFVVSSGISNEEHMAACIDGPRMCEGWLSMLVWSCVRLASPCHASQLAALCTISAGHYKSCRNIRVKP